MTTIPFDIPGGWLQPSQDRGVSQTAPAWAELVGEVFQPSPSITGAAVADLLRAIDEAATAAAVPNWDGEGALPVEGTTRDFARVFAAALPAGATPPEVSVDRDGDISFEWYVAPQRVFSVSVRRDGVLHYSGLFGPNKSHGSEVLLRGIPDPIAQGISRVQYGT